MKKYTKKKNKKNKYKKLIQQKQKGKLTKKNSKWLDKRLQTKLCKCIKKVKTKNMVGEKTAIGICRENIFNKRKIDLYTFKCKQRASLISKKGTKKKLRKFRTNIGFNKTKRSKKNK